MNRPVRNFVKERVAQRIDELVDLATRDMAEAKARARRLLEWLQKYGNSWEPEVEAAIQEIRDLLTIDC